MKSFRFGIPLISNLHRITAYFIILHLFISAPTNAQENILKQRITIQLGQITLGEALNALERQTGYELIYSPNLVQSDRSVHVSFNRIPLQDILLQLLGNQASAFQVEGLQIYIKAPTGYGQLKGSVHTSDGKAAAYVSISVKGGPSTQTDESGQFSFQKISAGQQRVVANLLGLQAQERSVHIEAGKSGQLEFSLKEDAQMLAEVIINGRQGARVIDTPSASLRIQSPLMETPQNIVSIGSTTIREQQLITPSEIARNISGVTDNMPYAGASTGFSIRGTAAGNNRLRNGLPISTMIGYGILQEDMSYVENIEFIKGPAGFMLAQGEPGGMFNVVTKKPLPYQHASVDFMVGSYGLYRSAVDVGGLLSRRVSYRLNVMGQKSGTHVNYGQNNRFSLAPVLQYQVTDRTRITLEYNLDIAGLLGTNNVMPTVDRQPLPRDLLVGDPGVGQTKLHNHYGYINVQHQFNQNWKLTSQAGIMLARWQGKDLYALNAIVDEQGLLARRFRYIEFYDDFYSAQIFLNGNFRTGTLSHQLLAGFDGGVLHTKGKHADVRNTLPLDVYHPSYGLTRALDTLIDTHALSFGYDNEANSLGIPQTMSWQAAMLQDQITFAPWINLTLGGRYTYYSNGGSNAPQTDKVFTPRAGLVLHPFANTSFYALYDQSFLQQAGQAFDGSSFKPLTGNNMELGLKREWLEKALFTQVSVFQITKNNVLTSDINNPGFNVQWGQVKSEGVEVDIIGKILPGLHTTANYAYINARVSKDADPLLVGTRPANPIHNANIWFTYRFSQGTFKGLGFGAGGSYQKDRYVSTFKKEDSDIQQKLPNYKSIDAAVYYRTGPVSLTLNLYNLADTYNFSANSFNYLAGKSGEYFMKSLPGRNFRLSVRFAL